MNAWADHICSVTLAGESHKSTRQLFKTLLENAWDFANWLTHSKSPHWHDAEAAVAVALSLNDTADVVRLPAKRVDQDDSRQQSGHQDQQHGQPLLSRNLAFNREYQEGCRQQQ